MPTNEDEGDHHFASADHAMRAGMQVWEAGAEEQALSAFEWALRHGLVGRDAVTVRCYSTIIRHKLGHYDRAAEHGEEALRMDAKDRLGAFGEREDYLRDQFFTRLEAAWGKLAVEADNLTGTESARSYLFERLQLVGYLRDSYFPYLRVLIANRSLQLKDWETASKNYIDAVASDFPQNDDMSDPDIRKMHEMYHSIRVEAGERLEELVRLRKADQAKCWIASAAYGPTSPEVEALRHFRDMFLLPSPIGRLFVKGYYLTAPSLASLMERSSLLRATLRNVVVAPAVRIARWANQTKHP